MDGGAEGESLSGGKHSNFPVSRRWGLCSETLSSPPPRPSPPQATSPTPGSPPRWNFTAKPSVGEGRGEGPSAGSGDGRTRHPDFVLRVGEPSKTTTRLFSAPELRMPSSLEGQRRPCRAGLRGMWRDWMSSKSSIGVDGYLSTPMSPRTWLPCPGALSDPFLRGGPGEVFSHCFVRS